MTSMEELACTYSALILADDDIPITAEKISTLLKAANVSVESIWPTLFARALGNINVKKLVTEVGAGGGGMVAATAPVSAEQGIASAGGGGSATPAKPEVKEEVKKEDSEEEDEDMGFGLFD